MRFELMNMRWLALMLGVCGGLLCVAPATAQNFPEKNITLLHAYSPGSSSAVLLRSLADAAGKTADQHRKQWPEQEEDEAAAPQDRHEIAPGDDEGGLPG